MMPLQQSPSNKKRYFSNGSAGRNTDWLFCWHHPNPSVRVANHVNSYVISMQAPVLLTFFIIRVPHSHKQDLSVDAWKRMAYLEKVEHGWLSWIWKKGLQFCKSGLVWKKILQKKQASDTERLKGSLASGGLVN